ncbi:MAG: SDR family NAD(P)-dependent oxidoreductase [Ferrimicrobium sp.]
MRWVVVTGAGRGIGAATVLRLVERGLCVLAIDGPTSSVVGYRLSGVADLRALQDASRDQIEICVCDVRDRSALIEAVTRLGPHAEVVGAVAAAGVIAGGEWVEDVSEAVVGELFDVNVGGVLNLAAATLPALRRSAGVFCAVSSAAGERGLTRLVHYTATKHAVNGIVRGLARDEGPRGVRVVGVAPGSTRTEMLQATADIYGLASVEEFSRYHLDHQLNEASEVADTIDFLLSASASAINGVVVPVDRGFSG